MLLDRIDDLLTPGGVWLNLGPLSYHHSTTFPKLSHAEMVSVFVDGKGYTLENRTVFSPTTYVRGMETSLYGIFHVPVFTSLRKPMVDPEL